MNNSKKRRPIIAFFLSIITIGLGQVYNGQLKKGIIFYAITIFFTSLFLGLCIFTEIFCKFENLQKASLIPIPVAVWYLLCSSDAFINAIRIKELNLRRYNRWYIYLIIMIITNFLPLWGIASIYERDMFKCKTFKIPAASMYPTLEIGDLIVGDISYYKTADPKRNDVIIFIYPEDETKIFIKRVVGIEGDTILIKEKKLYINDMLMDDPFAVHLDNAIMPEHVTKRDYYGPVVVPQDSLFVMGDNRDRSADSRFWGFVPRSKVKGKALYIYRAHDKTRIGKNIN